MSRATTRALALAIALAVTAAACSAEEAGERPLVVTTTALLADVVADVGSGEVDVVSLLPPGGDPERDPGLMLADLDRRPSLVVTVGLGFEEGMRPTLAEAAASGIPVVEVAPVGEPLEALDGRLDPRIWLDPLRMATAAPLIARWLTGVVPELGVDGWQSRGRAFADEMRSLHDRVALELDGLGSLSGIAPGLDYIAERYGLERLEPPRSPAIVDGTDRDPPALPSGVEAVPVPLDDLGDASGYEEFLLDIAAAIRSMGR